MRIEVRRIYSSQMESAGKKVLVDRLWPRGVRKSSIDLWLKEIAPSDELRRWFNHDPDRWAEFRGRYFRELDSKPELVGRLLSLAGSEGVVLLFSSREEKLNNATALKEYLERVRP